LDDASTRSYVNADVAAELGLQGTLQKITVNVLNGQTESFETKPVSFRLESVDGSIDEEVSALTTKRVTGDLQVVDWQQCGKEWDHLRNIKFPNIGRRHKVDLLIGLDYLQFHQSYEDVCGKPGEPMARRTPLGWTCIGSVTRANDCEQTHFASAYYVNTNADSQLNSMVERFWQVEEIPTPTQILNQSDAKVLQKANNAMVHNDGKYQVGIPWKEDAPTLPDDYDMAFRRLLSTEKKLSKDKSTAQAYDTIISKYVDKGYIRKVDSDEPADRVWYLPHFPVLRPEKSTTKVRIVFDASAKYQNVSLNDAIHAGPKLQRELFDVLIRFRRNPVAIVCDITEMFLQIELAPEDRPYHRFLWRSMDRDKPPDIYEFKRVVFGVSASPFLAQLVTQEHAKEHQTDLPLAAETVLKSTYMDDSMDSVENESLGVELYQQLTQLWSGAGMHAKKWLSNSLKVLENIPIEDRASEIDLNKGGLPSIKTLGLMWIASQDVFTFKVDTPIIDKVTKRTFLSQVARLFDPLGLIAPFTTTAKILLQEMWTNGYGWDDEVPQYLTNKVQQWLNQWQEMRSVAVPRYMRLDAEVRSIRLHTFVDASEEAYGSVVYAVHTYLDGSKSSRIVAGKSRVAPLKAYSIPRLELMAAILGLRLVQEVAATLEVGMDEVTLWSDSMNVLGWIRNKSRSFKPFVANRVGEIQTVTNPTQWRHVSSECNPADLLSRGESAKALIGSQLWWSGPNFLEKDKSEWPDKLQTFEDNIDDKEKKSNKKNVALVSIDESENLNCWRLEPSRFSNWSKLTRITAWVYRFLQNSSVEKKNRTVGELTVDEINDAEAKIIVQTQVNSFPVEYKALAAGRTLPTHSTLLPLNPQLDEQGLMRLSGRLVNAECLPMEARYPIILPRKIWVTRLIVKSYHEKGNHSFGTNQLMSELSSRYWIISAREEIREFQNKCAKCLLKKAKPRQQVMAPLPKLRLQSLRAFDQIGVDFAGPFITRQGRGKTRCKRYLCLFTCLSTRAVHLEMAYGMDTGAFLNAFYRMTNRRGLPTDVISDNGTNFVGAVSELKELFQKIDKNAVRRSAADRRIRWHFNPPGAPHFGGVFETMIKAAKRAIFAILGNGDVTDEELQTSFTGAEALLNSRPLTYQSAHPNDEAPLTPNHFLHGQAGGKFAPDADVTTNHHPRRRWRRVQELLQHFWKRWMKEWLPSLNTRRKWNSVSQDVREGDIVLVINPDIPRGHWKLGVIVKTYPGSDRHVRVVDVRIGQSVFKRPVTKICPLEW
jgi:ribonuclease HI